MSCAEDMRSYSADHLGRATAERGPPTGSTNPAGVGAAEEPVGETEASDAISREAKT